MLNSLHTYGNGSTALILQSDCLSHPSIPETYRTCPRCPILKGSNPTLHLFPESQGNGTFQICPQVPHCCGVLQFHCLSHHRVLAKGHPKHVSSVHCIEGPNPYSKVPGTPTCPECPTVETTNPKTVPKSRNKGHPRCAPL